MDASTHVKVEMRPEVLLRLHREVQSLRAVINLWRPLKWVGWAGGVSALLFTIGASISGTLFGVKATVPLVVGLYGLILTGGILVYRFMKWQIESYRAFRDVRRVVISDDLRRLDFMLTFNDRGLEVERADGSRSEVGWNDVDVYVITPMTVRLFARREEWGKFPKESLGSDVFEKLAALTKLKVSTGTDRRRGG